MKDIIWLNKNGYKDITKEMKLKGMVPPIDTLWSEWSMNGRRFVTTNNKFYAKS
jgi:hypothetical protein